MPKRGQVDAVTFRPTEKFNPINWVGKVAEPEKPKKSPSAGSRRAEGSSRNPARGLRSGNGSRDGRCATSSTSGEHRCSTMGWMTALPTSLTLGSLTVETPVVLAPMAGITNAAYRRLCAEQGAGLYVCEMITSRGLVERDETTLKMLVFDDLERIRSVQLYGTDPVYVGKAAEILCAEYGVAHIDLNFGCPVPKVTRKGGGGALPWKRGLLGEILASAVGAATPYGVPVTMKTRKGIDEDHLTYLDAGRIAEDSGCAAIALHGRTVAQSYWARPTGTPSPGSSSTSRCPCWATATSGRPATRSGWSSRRARPAWSWAAVAWGTRGSSVTWRRPSHPAGRPPRCCPRWARYVP